MRGWTTPSLVLVGTLVVPRSSSSAIPRQLRCTTRPSSSGKGGLELDGAVEAVLLLLPLLDPILTGSGGGSSASVLRLGGSECCNTLELVCTGGLRGACTAGTSTASSSSLLLS